MEEIIASGPVVIYDGKIILTKDNKDDFYKIPGGKIKPGETPKETARREFAEETGLEIRIKDELSTQVIKKNPTTGKEMKITLKHYRAELTSPPKDFEAYSHNRHEVRWIPLTEIQDYKVGPNIKFLLEKGELI